MNHEPSPAFAGGRVRRAAGEDTRAPALAAWLARLVCLALACLAAAQAAERVFDFTTNKLDAPPTGFRSTVAGVGQPGDWRIILDDVPPALAPLLPNAPALTKRPVLAQLSQDQTDEHFPLLIFDQEVFGDFTLTTKFKTVAGAREQMAGVAFRIQDERNFYVVRASSRGNTFRFYKVVNGARDNPIGPELEIPKGVWHELAVDCKGNRIRLRLNGKEPIPELSDSTFTEGKIGFWTKSDSVSFFTDIRLSYTPRECLAKAILAEMRRKHPRLLGLKIFATSAARPQLHLVASDDDKDIGKPAGQVEKDTVGKDAVFYGKSGQKVFVTMPLHDRNGDPIAAVRLVMESFPGQTEANALGRATPIIKEMEARVRSATDLTQ
jgi:hypothetical protein